MTQQEILNTQQTKTWKIQQLLSLGLTRNEVAILMNVGYGFVQNIFAQQYPDRIRHNRARFREAIEGLILTNFVFNHTFGVEIEAYGCPKDRLVRELTEAGINVYNAGYTHDTTPQWKIVRDSSISGNNPFELVSPKLNGLHGLEELRKVSAVLKRLNVKINKSCGLHIHFDASEFSKETWLRIFKNYAKLELIIDSFMPHSRRANNQRYCKSVRVTNFANKLQYIKNRGLDLESTLRSIKSSIAHNSRYSKINVESYWRHQSVEFRQHSGTIEIEKMENWILFLARLIEFSKTNEVQREDWNALQGFLTEEQIAYFKQRTERLSN